MSRKGILIVDAEGSAATELDATLRGFGYDVAAIATSGLEAIALTERSEPNLIPMDAVLDAEMDGFRVAESIRERRSIPIIFTAAATADATVHGLDATQPFGYVLKPFTEGELRVHIDVAFSDGPGARAPGRARGGASPPGNPADLLLLKEGP